MVPVQEENVKAEYCRRMANHFADFEPKWTSSESTHYGGSPLVLTGAFYFVRDYLCVE
jgi:hypothetical protein